MLILLGGLCIKDAFCYSWQEGIFEPDFLQAVAYAKSNGANPEGLIEFLQEEEGK
jgi:uncharacterized integral membrane protein